MMKHLTRELLTVVLKKLPNTFDAHELERRTLRTLPIQFAEELLKFRMSDDPLQQFSAAFAQWFDWTFEGEISKTRKLESVNLGGLMSLNQEWEKLNPSPTA